MPPTDAADLAMQFRELGDFIDAGHNPGESLQRVVRLAQDTVDGCDWAAVTRAGATPRTLAVSDDTARAIDDLQIAVNDGPCLTAARDDVIVHVPDLIAETRWPRFRERAVAETQVRAMLSFEVDATTNAPTALNLYSRRTDPFDAAALATAALFATHTQLALLHLNAMTSSANLRQALTTSPQIGEAVGVLMATQKSPASRRSPSSSAAVRTSTANCATWPWMSPTPACCPSVRRPSPQGETRQTFARVHGRHTAEPVAAAKRRVGSPSSPGWPGRGRLPPALPTPQRREPTHRL